MMSRRSNTAAVGSAIYLSVCLQGAIVQVTTQTQPGLPATSSPDAVPRGAFRTAREAIFARELLEKDFGITCAKPRLCCGQTVPQLCRRASAWGLAQSFDTLRCEFYVWDAIQAKLLSLAKVKGTVN